MASSSGNKEILKPVKAYLISSPSIRTNFNSLIMWELLILIPTLYMDLSFEDNAWRKRPSSRVDTFNRSNLFLIAWLYERAFAIVISSSNYLSSSY
jgi:hypothetical protein